MCGKYKEKNIRRLHLKGSPPRVREVLDKIKNNLRCLGITPACAGSMPEMMRLKIVCGDHPRVCGKYEKK